MGYLVSQVPFNRKRKTVNRVNHLLASLSSSTASHLYRSPRPLFISRPFSSRSLSHPRTRPPGGRAAVFIRDFSWCECRRYDVRSSRLEKGCVSASLFYFCGFVLEGLSGREGCQDLQVRNLTIAASTATMPLMMLIMTPAMALITVMMQSPIAWKQDITAPIFAVCVCW